MDTFALPTHRKLRSLSVAAFAVYIIAKMSDCKLASNSHFCNYVHGSLLRAGGWTEISRQQQPKRVVHFKNEKRLESCSSLGVSLSPWKFLLISDIIILYPFKYNVNRIINRWSLTLFIFHKTPRSAYHL